jgi:hypothetical protein
LGVTEGDCLEYESRKEKKMSDNEGDWDVKEKRKDCVRENTGSEKNKKCEIQKEIVS